MKRADFRHRPHTRHQAARALFARSLGALAGAVLAIAAQSSHALLLLDENFNDNAASYGTILAGEATANSINIRLGNNVINTAGDTGFDSFFDASPNRFLVLGNNAGDIVGEPNGQTIGARMIALFDLGSFASGQHNLSVSFDFVFDTNYAPGASGTRRNIDDFSVLLLDDTNNLITELLGFDDVLRNEASRRGTFDQTLDFVLAGAGGVRLAFDLIEYDGTASSAAGIDNIRVLSVPEPGSLALLSLGLFALGRTPTRRRS